MKRIANVELNRCVACGACTKACARRAIAIWRGCYAFVDEEKCVGCGLCAKVCPVGCIAFYKSYLMEEPEHACSFSLDRDGIMHIGGESA